MLLIAAKNNILNLVLSLHKMGWKIRNLYTTLILLNTKVKGAQYIHVKWRLRVMRCNLPIILLLL